MKFRMQLEYPNGTICQGKRNMYPFIDTLKLNKLDWKNISILDIACDEGFWAFWTEMQGASNVHAIDVEKGENYDWGFEKNTNWIKNLNDTRIGKTAFDIHHKNLDSEVNYRNLSVYNISQINHQFDVIFNFGLLYHLRHPLLSLEKCSENNVGYMILETHVNNSLGSDYPVCHFYGDKQLNGGPSNWSGPSTSCVVHWLYDLDYKTVFGYKIGKDREIFVACKQKEYIQHFQKCSDLKEYDTTYIQKTKFSF